MAKSDAEKMREAIVQKNKKEVLNLIAKGVDPDIDINVKHSDDKHYIKKPLYIAVLNDQIEIVKTLLEFRKVDVNYQNGFYGSTALCIAVSNLNLDMIELLVNVKDININAKQSSSEDPIFLDLFTPYSHFDIDLKISIKQFLGDQATPDMVKSLCEMKRTKIIELFLNNPNLDINIPDYWKGNSALHYAVESGYIGIVNLLLNDNRINPNILNERGDSALHIALEKRDEAMLKCLIESDKVNQGVENSKGLSILHQAVQNNDLEMTKFLLTFDRINVNALTKAGETLIGIALKTGNKEMIELLLESKVDLNIQDSEGNTALHKAILSENLEIVVKLLFNNKGKLDLSIKNNDKLTPVELAKIGKIRSIEEAVKEYGGNLDNNEKSNTVLYSPNEENEISLVGENHDDNVDLFGITYFETSSSF